MNFSIILNSRGRVPLLRNLLESVRRTAADLSNIEVLIAIDNDDFETNDFLKSFKDIPNLKIFSLPRPESLNSSLTFLGLEANGKYIFNLNDDVEILTTGWDTIVLDSIAVYKKSNNIKDDVIYCAVYDNSVDKAKNVPYASFPIISKEAVQLIKTFMYPAFVGLGGDSSIFMVYQAIDRVVSVPQVSLDHIYHNTIFAVMTPDLTAYEMRSKSREFNLDPFTYDVSKEVKILERHIKSHE